MNNQTIFILLGGGALFVLTACASPDSGGTTRPQETPQVSSIPPSQPIRTPPVGERNTSPVLESERPSIPSRPVKKRPEITSAPASPESEAGLFEFLKNEPQMQVKESTTGSSIRGDEVPEEIRAKRKQNTAQPSADNLTQDYLYLRDHPALGQTRAVVYKISQWLNAALENRTESSHDLERVLIPHHNEISKQWFPEAQRSLNLIKKIQPRTPEAGNIQRTYQRSLLLLTSGLRLWTMAGGQSGIPLYKLGYQQIRQAEAFYRSALLHSQILERRLQLN